MVLWSSNSTPGYSHPLPPKTQAHTCKKTYMRMFWAALFIKPKPEWTQTFITRGLDDLCDAWWYEVWPLTHTAGMTLTPFSVRELRCERAPTLWPHHLGGSGIGRHVSHKNQKRQVAPGMLTGRSWESFWWEGASYILTCTHTTGYIHPDTLN